MIVPNTLSLFAYFYALSDSLCFYYSFLFIDYMPSDFTRSNVIMFYCFYSFYVWIYIDSFFTNYFGIQGNNLFYVLLFYGREVVVLFLVIGWEFQFTFLSVFYYVFYFMYYWEFDKPDYFDFEFYVKILLSFFTFFLLFRNFLAYDPALVGERGSYLYN